MTEAAEKKKEGGRTSGGMLCVVKNEVLPPSVFKLVETSDDRSFCFFEAKGTAVGLDKNLYIGVVYFPPENSGYNVSLEAFFETVVKFLGMGYVLFGGDFNARIGSESGYLPDVATENPMVIPARRSLDLVKNQRGRQLLDFCKEHSLVILNGRTEGDAMGAFTYLSHSAKAKKGGATELKKDVDRAGASVVDYFVSSDSLYPHIRDFQVLPILGRCDHCPISVSFNLTSTLQSQKIPGDRVYSPKRYRWRKDKKKIEQYRVALLSTFLDFEIKDSASLSLQHFEELLDGVLRKVFGVRPAGLRPSPATRCRRGEREWFTADLKRLRRAVKTAHQGWTVALAALSQNPEEPGAIRAAGNSLGRLQRARKMYRTAIARAKIAYQDQTSAEFVREFRKNPRQAWARLFSSAPLPCPAGPSDCRAFFHDVLNPKMEAEGGAPAGERPAVPPPPLHPAPVADPAHRERLEDLNKDITPEELGPILDKLKNNKAADAFGFKGEMFKTRESSLMTALAKVLNQIFKEGFPASLACSSLMPLYKGKGDKTDLNSYRGIAIMPIIAKIYAMVLEARLTAAAEELGLRSDYQFGFRPGRGTRDAVFVLDSLITAATKRERRGKKEERALYVAFVDFKKAFDTVDRQKLWDRLSSLGINGTYLSALQSYYTSVLFSVLSAEGPTDPFSADAGVKQGCPLSPTLFGLFIESIAPLLLQEESGSPSLGNLLVPLLLYADDLALCSLNPQGLQRKLELLERFCEVSGMTVNVQKTKVVVFRNQQKMPMEVAFTYKGQPVEVVDEFKYLGLIFHSYRGFEHALEHQFAAASKRLSYLMHRARVEGVRDAKNLITLFDSLIRSILAYCAEVWAPRIDVHSKLVERIERLHARFLKYLLRVPLRTPTRLLYLETGRYPLHIKWFHTCVLYFNSISGLPVNHILRQALGPFQRLNHNWFGAVTDMCRRMAFYATGIDQAIDDFSVKYVLDSAKGRFYEKEVQALNDAVDRPERYNQYTNLPGFSKVFAKYRHYCISVTDSDSLLQRPKYLLQLTNPYHRKVAALCRTQPEVFGIPTWAPARGGTTCPHCQHGKVSIEHALVCPKAQERREARGINPEESLVSYLKEPSVSFISFVLSIKSLYT